VGLVPNASRLPNWSIAASSLPLMRVLNGPQCGETALITIDAHRPITSLGFIAFRWSAVGACVVHGTVHQAIGELLCRSR